VTPPRFDVVAVGSAVVDYTHRVTALPRVDEGVLILDRFTGPGGVDRNVAAAAARLGLRVGIIAHVGTDEAGAMLTADFHERGIDHRRLQIGGADDTAYSLVFVDERGDRMIMTGGRGVRGLTLDEADDAYIRDARVCFASGYLPWPHLRRVADLCAAADGPLLAFDLPGSRHDLERRGTLPADIEAILPDVDLFFADRKSLVSYSGEEAIGDGIARILERGARRVAVSGGARGVHLAERGTSAPAVIHVPAYPVRVVDTTGAGDVLHAALIASWLLGGLPMESAGRFAAAAAALSCRDWGVSTSLPTRAEAEALAAAAMPNRV
jgi:sugar/nucleoside kinase (ribokinase family)